MAKPVSPKGSEGPLTCPRCALAHPIDERFCRNCGMPLVYAGTREEEPITDAHERARKVRPQYARGDLVRVTGGRHLAEAELIQGILLEQGIPSVLRRARGFDVPDFLAAGPRDVLVPESGYQAARELLRGADLLTVEAPTDSMPGIGSPLRLAVGILVAVGLAALLVFALYQLTT
jgi:pimeloyl-ACP methyl ester carboxylesterase